MFPNLGAVKRPVPFEILGRIRRHFVGRVVTLAVATAFNAILSVVFYPSQPDIWGQATRGFMEGSSPIRENMSSIPANNSSHNVRVTKSASRN